MKYVYSVRCDRLDLHGNVTRVYGVDVRDGKCTVKSSVNLFVSKEEAEDFVAICNRLDLDIIHFDDVVLDLLKGRELGAVMD